MNAPSSVAEEEENDNFYEEIRQTMMSYKINFKNQLIVMGDFSSQIGKKMSDEEEVTGKYGYK